MSDGDDRALIEAGAGSRLCLIAESFFRLTGRRLVQPGADTASGLWGASRVILAHGIEPDPIFFYANRLALDRFEIAASAFLRMPSRLCAEAPLREERAVLLARVARDGFIDDYAGSSEPVPVAPAYRRPGAGGPENCRWPHRTVCGF